MNKKADCDNVLTAKIISGNKTAFKEVYSKHWKGMFVIADRKSTRLNSSH